MFIISFATTFIVIFITLSKKILINEIPIYIKFSFSIILSFGIFGIIGSLLFIFDLKLNEEGYYIINLIGIILLCICYSLRKDIINLMNINIKLENKNEYFFCIIIIYMFFTYIFRATMPWYDQDEINVYGHQIKLISSGFTKNSNIQVIIGWPIFQENMLAIFYNVLGNTFLPKIFKVVG